VVASFEPLKKEKRKRGSLEEEVEWLRGVVVGLAAKPGPVLAGPFTGEVGFELLYWIPLLRWAVREVPDLRGRLVVVSRGGVHGWVEGLDARYVDILSLFSPEEFARHRAIADKQREVRPFDDRVVQAVRERLGALDAPVLHPSLMYEAYFRFLKIHQLAYPRHLVPRPDGVVDGLTAVYAPIARPDRAALPAELPRDYVAVRFYSRDSFPDSPQSAGFASAVIEALCRHTAVVVIGTRVALDEHRDVQGRLPDGVFTIDHAMRPEDNLAVQTAVVAHAKAFVGTYGGFSYLAPFLGVPSISFSIDREKTQSWHYELAQGIFAGPAWGDFVALRHSDLALVDLVTRGFQPAGVPLRWERDAALRMEGGVRGS
jgi:hypothetical protein